MNNLYITLPALFYALYIGGLLIPVVLFALLLASLFSKNNASDEKAQRLNTIGVILILAVAIASVFLLFLVLKSLWTATAIYLLIGCFLGHLASKNKLIASAIQARRKLLAATIILSVSAIVLGILVRVTPGEEGIYRIGQISFYGLSLYCLLLSASTVVLRRCR